MSNRTSLGPILAATDSRRRPGMLPTARPVWRRKAVRR